MCNPIFPQASQRHDSEKLGTNSVDVKSCESPEMSPGRRLQGRRPTPPGSQATRSKRFAACAADKEPNCQTLLPWVLIAIDSSILAFFWECLDLGVAWVYNCYHTKEFSWPDSQCSPACKLASLKHYQHKPLSGDAPLMWREWGLRSSVATTHLRPAPQALGWLRHVETNCRGRGRKGHEAEIIPVILTTPKMVPNMCESLTKPWFLGVCFILGGRDYYWLVYGIQVDQCNVPEESEQAVSKLQENGSSKFIWARLSRVEVGQQNKSHKSSGLPATTLRGSSWPCIFFVRAVQHRFGRKVSTYVNFHWLDRSLGFSNIWSFSVWFSG